MLNLGGLFFTLDADTRGLMNAQREIQSFANNVSNAFKSVSGATSGPGFANGLLRQERSVMTMLERVKTLQDKINSSGIDIRAKSNILKDVTSSYDAFVRRMSTPVPLNTADFSRNVMHMKSELKDLEREFQKLNQGMGSATGFSNFSGVLRGMGGASLLVQGHLGGMSTRFFALTSLVREFGSVAAVTAASVAGLSAGIGLLTTNAVRAGRELQGLTAGFTALTGNALVAGQHLEFVKDVSNQAGTGFTNTAKGYMRFLASAQAGGLTLQQTQDSFRGVSLAAATMQLSIEDTQGVYRALDQMLSKGTVQAEELRGQLGDRLPGAFNIAAVAMGKTTAQLTKMMKDGDVISSEFVPKFVEALQRMWNIDPEKPINTLTAAIGRLGDQWTYFGQELDKNTGATRVFQSVVESLASALKMVSANLPAIISGIGALTGAFIGLGVAMAINNALAWIRTMGGMGAVLTMVYGNVRNLIVGITTLNTVMLANPIARVVSLLITLGSTLLGAKLGYDALNKAVSANAAAFDETESIRQYIQQQKALGFQVRSTTADITQQTVVMARQAAANARTAADEVRRLNNPNRAVSTTDAWIAMQKGFSGEGFNVKNAMSDRLSGAVDEANLASAKARELTKLLGELQGVSELPGPPSVDSMLGTGKKDKGSKMSDAINQVEDFILRMTRAEERLKELSSGNRNYKLVDDLFKAKEALNQLNPKQLSAVDEALRAAGFSSGTLDERLGAVLTRTREAEEAARIFTQVWDDLDQGAINLERLNKQLSFIRSGGDPKALANFDAYARAGDMLRNLNATTKAGQDALLGMQGRLRALGIETSDTGDILEDTKSALAAFFQQEDQGQQLVKVFSNLHEETTKLKDRLTELSLLGAATQDTSLGGLFGDPAEAAKQVSNAVKRGQAVRDLVRDMQLAGASQAEINQKATEYLGILRQVDTANDVYDRMREKAEQTRDSLRSMVQAGASAFRDLISGAKSFGEALMDVATKALDALWQRFITQPIDDMLFNMGQKASQKKTQGIDTSIAGIAANDNGPAGQVNALGAAASAAAQMMQGNFIGALAQGAVSLFTSASAEATKAATTAAATSAQTQQLVANLSVTASMRMVAQAAQAAATALAQVGGGSGGSGGLLGSIFGSIFGGATGDGAPGTAGGMDLRGFGLAKGGRIVGPGTGTSDSIFAMIDGIKPLFVSNGESVVNAKATRQFWPLIDAMNKGRLPQAARKAIGFADGGLAGTLIPSVAGFMSASAANSNGPTYVDASGDIYVQGNVGPNELAELRKEMRSREARIAAMIPGQVDYRMIQNKLRRPAFGGN